MSGTDRSPALDPGLAAMLASIRESLEAPRQPGAAQGEEDAALPSVSGPPAGPAAQALAAAAPSPSPASTAPSPTLDVFLAELARPLIREWLDRHLAEIVQQAVDAELKRMLRPPG